METSNLPAGRPLQTSRSLFQKQEFHVLNEIIFRKVWKIKRREKSNSKIEIITENSFQVNQKPTWRNETEKIPET